MNKETDDLRPKSEARRPLDPFDRKILSELVRDGRQTYAEIGARVSLSAPAVHERVKRLKARGVIKGTSAMLDAKAIDKPFLAFVHVDAHGWGKSRRMMELLEYPEVEELHSVTGDACMIMKVRTENADALEQFMAQLYAVPGVRGTKSYVVLTSYLDRPVQAEVTKDWPEWELIED